MLRLIIGLSTFAVLKLNKFTVNAYTGINIDLTEKELYNETNTYNVSDSNFNERGVFRLLTRRKIVQERTWQCG